MRELNLPARRIQVVENGVDGERFGVRDRQSSRTQLGLPVSARIILYVGNLKRDKGCIDLFEAAIQVLSQIPEAVLVYVGDGDRRQEILDRASQQRLQDRVLLVGRKTHEEVPVYLGAADVLVLPSHAEGLPNVVLEAFASGRPVVGTEVGAMPALLQEGGGALVPARNPAALAAGILSVLGSHFDPETLRMLTSGRSWKSTAQQTADVLTDAVSGGEAP
jgi:glycosyltransferase involved in cell wall biosynthesis